MRLLTILLLTIPVFSYAQNVVVLKKDGTQQSVSVSAFSSAQLFTKTGNVNYSDLDAVDFTSDEPSYANLQTSLAAAGVKILIAGNEKPMNVPSQLLVSKSPTGANDQVTIDLEKFKQQRNIGKGFEILGILATNALLVASMEGEKVESWMFGAAGGVTLMGFVIDISASKHLSKNR